LKKETLIIDLYKPATILLDQKPECFNLIVYDENGQPDFCEENIEIIVKGLRTILAIEIDKLTKKNKLTNYVPHIYDFLNNKGIECLEEGVIFDFMQDEMDRFYNLLDENEWALFDMRLNKHVLYIVRGDDWRALEYERLNEQNKSET